MIRFLFLTVALGAAVIQPANAKMRLFNFRRGSRRAATGINHNAL